MTPFYRWITLSLIFVSVPSLLWGQAFKPHGIVIATPSENVRPINMPILTVLSDASGQFTMIPKQCILKIDPKSDIKEGGITAFDASKFVKFNVFYASHSTQIALVQASQKAANDSSFVIYDDAVEAATKDKTVAIAVNGSNVPIMTFDRQAGTPLPQSNPKLR